VSQTCQATCDALWFQCVFLYSCEVGCWQIKFPEGARALIGLPLVYPFLSVTHIDILYTVLDNISLLVTICLEVFEKGMF